MRRMILMIVVVALAGCGGGQDEGWDIGDEPIVIWTIPRPGEEPVEMPDVEQPTSEPNDPDPDNGEGPELRPQPDHGRDIPVVPVACGAEYPTVTVPGTIDSYLTRGRGEIQETPCGISPGAERRFQLDVPRDMGVEISVSYDEADFPVALLLQSGCGEDTRDRYCSSPIGSHPEGLSAHIRADLKAGSYTLVVDERNLLGFGEGGAFVLHVEEVELDDTASCDSEAVLWPDNVGVVTAGNTGTTGDLLTCFGPASSRHFWQVQVPGRTAYSIDARYHDVAESQGPSIQIEDACYGDCGGPAGSSSLSIANEGSAPRWYTVSVIDTRRGGYDVFVSGSQRLAANAQCALATLLEPNRRVVGDLMAGAAEEPICGGNMSRQLHYMVDVPAGHRLDARASTAVVNLRSSCDDQQCGVDPVNDTGATQTYLFSVGDWAGGHGQFELTPHVIEVAANARCESALPLGEETEWVDLAQGRDEVDVCQVVFPGRGVFYEVTVPPMRSARVEALPSDSRALSLGVLDSCAGTCVARRDAYFEGPGLATVEFANDSAESQSYIVQVMLSDSSSVGPVAGGYTRLTATIF